MSNPNQGGQRPGQQGGPGQQQQGGQQGGASKAVAASKSPVSRASSLDRVDNRSPDRAGSKASAKAAPSEVSGSPGFCRG